MTKMKMTKTRRSLTSGTRSRQMSLVEEEVLRKKR